MQVLIYTLHHVFVRADIRLLGHRLVVQLRHRHPQRVSDVADSISQEDLECSDLAEAASAVLNGVMLQDRRRDDLFGVRVESTHTVSHSYCVCMCSAVVVLLDFPLIIIVAHRTSVRLFASTV